MPLSDRQISNLRSTGKPKKVADGAGLYVLLTATGSKLWQMAYRYNGKQKVLSFGQYPSISLADARMKRDAAKKILASGLDPGVQSKIDKTVKSANAENTFERVAIQLLEKNAKEGKAEATIIKKRWLLGLATPDIGNRPIAEISAAEILVPLKKIEALGNFETAKRLRSFIGQVFRYAISMALATNDPTYGLKGALIAPRVTHMAAVTDWAKFEGLVRAVWNYTGTIESQCALKLMVLLYPRPGELRKAEWFEFDLANVVWTIPAERTKMRRLHKKHLSEAAIEVLRELQKHTGNRRLAFPSMLNPERPLSENTLNAALRRMGIGQKEATSHGFRASASTLLNESGLWSADAIEAELAHFGADEVRRAYHRAAYWDERIKMANWWSAKITEVTLKK